ncbi:MULTISPECIES: cytochrome b/b6 domain-containing protein [Shimia]|uniref:cytochrome b/b6 domain-containing protein n=1 Tax=Shimia TaxID=573139 RepID=UPI001FB52F77|nr:MULTISPECIES: cytochrome b/b6 domain-containing protein [Shimia]MDV4144804.1 cytochrome b/b6 domain-containing protein [Shimia sp. FJ5]
MNKQITEDVSQEKIWDIGTRLFHWALVICVAAAWGLGKFGPNIMTLHFYFGYAVIALLVFRVIWGLVGPAPVRFASFLYGPRTTLRYLRTLGTPKPSYWPGHNPMGALSVFAILAALIAQVGTGLFSDPDDFINVGPLAGYVSSEANRTATFIHNRMLWVILALVVLHIAAIAYYKRFKGENLVTPMITGWKPVRRDESRD